jgi:transcriptional regulator with XRE-family HTH domain
VRVLPLNESADAGDALAAGVELCALLRQLREAAGLTYDELAETSSLSRGLLGNYLNKPGHGRRLRELELLLVALGATEDEHARALDLLRRMKPGRPGVDATGWRARARVQGCTAWVMSEFTAHEASVHTAIGRRIDPAPPHSCDDQPPYVPRTHDPALRADITAAAAGELRALIVVRGTSSTGKTRSLWEAVRALCPGWAVIRPRSASAARDLPGSGLLDRPTVVWLNELQGFLGPDGTGLSVHVLSDLYDAATAPVVLVGTLWPDRIHALTGDDDGHDRRSEARELLSAGPGRVRWHEVAPALNQQERAVARELAAGDVRLARAVKDPDRVGFAQTLAGARR